MEDTQYEHSLKFWPGEGAVVVRDSRGQPMITVPIEFMRKGSRRTYRYVFDQLKATFDGEGTLYGPAGAPLDLDEQVEPVVLCFTPAEDSNLYPKRGPRFKYKYKPPTESSETSTMSNSKRSSANQSRFRVAVIARDGNCLLSEEHFESCTAAHILPQSRPELYAEVLQSDSRNLFDPSFGLLLRDDLHHSFDRGDWALFPHNSDYIVHFFKPRPSTRHLHGKILTRDRFRSNPEDLPHGDLLKFHYDQCAMMHLRGFAARMSEGS